jgi:hypothetical protein
MTAEEQIKRITEIINDLSLNNMTEASLYWELRSQSFDEIFENMWQLCSVIGEIADVLNAQEATDD